MARRGVGVLACLVALLVCAAHAQEECAGLQSQLANAEEALAAARSTESRCQAEAEALGQQLAEARQEVEALAAKLTAAEAEAKQLELSAAGLKLKAEAFEDTQAKLLEANAEAQAANSKVKDAQDALSTAMSRFKELQNELAEARAEAEDALKEAAKAEEVAQALEALKAVHESAWLPHWLEVRSRFALKAAGPALKAGQDLAAKLTGESGKKAAALWATHAKPSIDKALSATKDAIEKHGGTFVPKVKTAFAAAAAKVQAVLQSEQAAKVKAGAAAAAAKAQETFGRVVGELEAALITLLAKAPNSAPLARKPYVTYMAYAILGAPLVAVGLPLLGRLASARAAAAPASSGSRGSKGGVAPKRPKRRA